MTGFTFVTVDRISWVLEVHGGGIRKQNAEFWQSFNSTPTVPQVTLK